MDSHDETATLPRNASIKSQRAHQQEGVMTFGSRAYEEKRSFIRMKVDAMVSFTIEGKDGSNTRYEGRCKDISGAGLLLETSKKIPVGTRLHVTIPSENQNLGNLIAQVEIIRLTPYPEQHRYELGGIITQIKS